MKKTLLAFIGGSGLYDLPGIKNLREEEVSTPFGNPSDKILIGEINNKPVAFLPRHGKGHRFLPSEVNNRANIYALKKIGATHILSISAVGSLQKEIAPGNAVVPDQILDMTNGRKESFFGDGIVGHVSFADPFCSQLQSYVKQALEKEKRRPMSKEPDYEVTEGNIFEALERKQSEVCWLLVSVGLE